MKMIQAVLAFVMLVVVAGGSGCSHAVQLRMADDSPAEITVEGQNLGKAPVTYQEPWAMKGSTYTVECKMPNGTKVTETVTRSEMSWSAFWTSTGIGAGACAAVGLAAGCAGLFFFPAAFAGSAGCIPLIGGPLLGWLLPGQSPDMVVLGKSRQAAAPPMPEEAPPTPSSVAVLTPATPDTEPGRQAY